jgi:glutamate/tyrosine decarboxylase-like PLP-dependent enzyme
MDKDEDFYFLRDSFKVRTCGGSGKPGEEKLLFALSTWELQNLKTDDILEIPDRLYKEHGVSPAYLQKVMEKHGVQTVGKEKLEKAHFIENPMKVIVSYTNHYSWPKACALTGIGSENMIGVKVNNAAQIDTGELRRTLENCARRKEAVYAVIAIVGSTEEGAVDDVTTIVQLREELAKSLGLSFVIHVDAAWGGYFATMARPQVERTTPAGKERWIPDLVLSLGLRESVNRSYLAIRDCDSVTIDPHKSGYIPYPVCTTCLARAA